MGILTRKTYERIMENVIRRLVNEGFYGEEDEDVDPFKEYEDGYPGEDIDFTHVTASDLAGWCASVGDFYYIYYGLRGYRIGVANSGEIVKEIVGELRECDGIEPTHEMDYIFYNRRDLFMNDYVCVFRVNGVQGGDYYIVYQEDKGGRGLVMGENRQRINEAFKSNQLRSWFNEHGGVMNRFDGDWIDNRVRQDGLGDVGDDDIVYMQEFDDFNAAVNKKHELTRPDSYRRRSDIDMKAFFVVYRAKDGSCLLVGFDRNKVESGITWGGETTKKTADRKMTNGWNFKNRSDRYADDSDTYYYGKKGNYFGLHTNQDYKGKMEDNKNIRDRMTDEEWKQFQRARVEDIKGKE